MRIGARTHRIRGLLVAALALGVVLPVGAVGAVSDEVIEEEFAASGVPGLAYAVVVDGEVTEAGGRGVLNARGDEPVTANTQFLVGSITKSVTALAMMQLVEAGQMELDAPVSAYLDGFSGQPAGGVSIRQLLSHTSGFSTIQGNASPFVDIAGVRSTDEPVGSDALELRVDGLSAVVPDFGAGEQWQYSNLNYQIAGRVVEVVSGQEFQSYVAEHILEPIGMADSFVADGDVHDSMATGHRPWFIAKRPLPENSTDRVTAPQGGLVSSAHDLALYMATMMNGEDDVLSARGKLLMMRPANATSTFYGLGWFLDSDRESVWHSGSTPGFESLATMVPSERAGVVVLVNGGSGVGFGETTQVRNAITAAALGWDYAGEGSRWGQKALFLSLVLLPIGYLWAIVWAWRRPVGVRAKRGEGAFGLFSLWFPLLTTVVAAWFILWLMPTLFGSPLGTLALFQPGFGAALIATAVGGVVWAVARLGVAYVDRPGEERSAVTP